MLRIPPTRSLPCLPAAALVRHRHEVHPGPHGRGECTLLANLPCVPLACGGSGARGLRPRTSPCRTPRFPCTHIPLACTRRTPNDWQSCWAPWCVMHACVRVCTLVCACMQAPVGFSLRPTFRVARAAAPPTLRCAASAPPPQRPTGEGGWAAHGGGPGAAPHAHVEPSASGGQLSRSRRGASRGPRRRGRAAALDAGPVRLVVGLAASMVLPGALALPEAEPGAPNPFIPGTGGTLAPASAVAPGSVVWLLSTARLKGFRCPRPLAEPPPR